MSCEHCNSTKSFKGQQGFSNYDLWLQQGNSGTVAQYLASLVGTNGTNGIYLLSPYAAPASNTSGALQTLQTYTLINALASTTPFANGDILEIEARLTTDGLNTTKLIEINFGAVALTTGIISCFGYNQTKVHLKAVLRRVSNVSVTLEVFAEYYNGFVQLTPPQIGYYNPAVAVADLDTTDTVIALTGDGVVAGDITAYYQTVKLLKQP